MTQMQVVIKMQLYLVTMGRLGVGFLVETGPCLRMPGDQVQPYLLAIQRDSEVKLAHLQKMRPYIQKVVVLASRQEGRLASMQFSCTSVYIWATSHCSEARCDSSP